MNESAQRSDSDSLDIAEVPINPADSPDLVSTGSTLKPLRTFPPVRDVPENRSNDPMASDDFGNFSFKNLPVLEKANREVIQKLRAEAMQAQSKLNSQLPETPKPTFQCTFCHVKLSEKAWRRHEESQHVPRRQWTCMPLEHPFLLYSYYHSGVSYCCLCNATCSGIQPEHMKICPKRASGCLARSVEERTFHRKDHLVQHLKRFHNTTLTESQISLWEAENTQLNRQWGCGFCGEILPNWNERATHIAAHFRQGLDMSVWGSSRIVFDGAGENELPLITELGTDMLWDDGTGQRVEVALAGIGHACDAESNHDLSLMDLT
jgi:hypothetical protein